VLLRLLDAFAVVLGERSADIAFGYVLSMVYGRARDVLSMAAQQDISDCRRVTTYMIRLASASLLRSLPAWLGQSSHC
jgi:TctA family transporter